MLKACPAKATAMASVKIVPELQIVALFFISLCITTYSDDPSFYYPSKFGSSTPHEYTRFADVERHCQSVLSSAAGLSVRADRAPFPMDGLSFMNGDWSQDAGQAPLLPPFQGSYADAVAGEQLEAVNLASFILMHMDAAPGRGGAGMVKALNVSGVLTLSITRNCCCSSMEMQQRARTPEFVLRHGVAKIQIQFEGVYTETGPSGAATDDGGGERVLCMVGNAVLPVRGGNSSELWDWAKKNQGSGKFNSEASPPVVANDNILLVLRYPETRTLATRAVHGEMVSLLSAKSGGNAYFDKVRLVSMLHRYYSRYKFRPEDEALGDVTSGRGTNPSLSTPDTGGDAGHLFRGSGAVFCDILRQFTPDDYGVMDVIPNWNCSSTDDKLCSPFETTRPAATDGTVLARSAAVAVQGLECEPDGASRARVSAVFRFVPPWQHQPTAAKRTGLGGATLSAEGAWTASTGRLCMLACRSGRGGGKEEEGACRNRVTIYIPTTFSITRRAIIEGQITSTGDVSHSPVSFRQLVSPRHHWQQQQFGRAGETMRVAYNYTKQAIDLLLRHSEASGLNFRDNFIARSFLSYPKAAGAADDMGSLSNLGEDLGLRFRLSTKPQFVPDWIEEPFFQLQVLSIGSLVGSYQPPYQQGEYQSSMPFRLEQLSARYGLDKQDVLGVAKQDVLVNVSAEFTAASWQLFDSKSVISLEGVYNPIDGQMHLIGCRDVHAQSSSSTSSMSRDDLEDGMDCSIEVMVEYPPTTTRWLISPVAKVRVASTRAAGDPLHFNMSELLSLPIIYRDQRDELAEPKVEGFLCIAVLSVTVAATASQLQYIKSHDDVAPYISLSTLGVQALGYGATLVMEARTLPSWPTSRHGYSGYHDRLKWSVDCTVKALTLSALFLTARLAHKVRRARARARARSPLDPWRVASETLVLVYTTVVHLIGLFLVLSEHWLSSGVPDVVLYQQAQGFQSSSYSWRAGAHTHQIAAVVGRYFGIAKEWFLLPQVIGNAIWRVNCKPLAARYYAGVTTAWLLPHLYGYLRPPVVNPGEALQYSAMDLYPSKAIAVVVPVVGVVLALGIYVQQRWNYRIVGWVMKGGQNKLQHVY